MTQEYNVTRQFAHRTFGAIGSVALAGTAQLTLDGKPLPSGSVEYLLIFALQSLQDAYAGAQSADEAKANWEKKRDRLLDGTIGVRTSGGVDEATKVARSLIRDQLRKSPQWDAFKELAQSAQDAKLDELFKRNEEALAPLVDQEVKRREAERKAKAKLQSAISIEL